MTNVWYVDDDKNIIQAIQFMLKLLEHEMRPFGSAHDAAQALLAGEKPGIVILDANMPEASGVDLLEFIRGRPAWDQLPVILLGSENNEDQIQQAFDIGADGYVLKPILLDELEFTIQSAIEKRENFAKE